ncbi:HAD hydrolase-like protein [Pontibacter sp. SGAir0037]|uniref:HAD hydrolase-like protein n=1 Tax=Pontibacter sp. SGAir0037 TaxID=2571030 RepID=UPI0010CCE49F|nr:HAD hydrolase-like protein [Pontibacter sp. SGAir0037]QCR21130.1 hypothetical protein C1N53_01320 [Pontibacter sp. SGAir0037]
MTFTKEIVKEVKIKIETDTVLFFDMDGTLVNTDFANFLSYKEAIQSVVQNSIDILYNPDERFNRSYLKRVAPNLSEEEYLQIIQQKEKNFSEQLSHTELNKTVANIPLKYYNTNKTVLVTNCRENRAQMTLSHHNLSDKFSNIFFRQISNNGDRINKYKNAILSLGGIATVYWRIFVRQLLYY